ncbi:MAG: hypothetical protein SGJ10_04685 [Bacteroidota bacterium]|nr:hypothetical protein [Bacteroidota bacterium]
MIEYILNWIYNKNTEDPLKIALGSFQNNYFSLSKYYLTNTSGDMLTNDTSATRRFIVFYIIGYVIYAVLSVVIPKLPKIKVYSARINTILFYMVFIIAFPIAFFIPDEKTIIDLDSKEITLTKYNYYLIPSTERIPFSAINKFDYFWYSTKGTRVGKQRNHSHFMALQV